MPSPLRPLTQKQLNAQRVSSLSGVPIERAHHSKSRKPLERVLTDNKAKSRKPPATLTRSATDSAVPGLKHELSEMALSSIPATRPSLQESKRYSQREVDLTAVSQATQVKLQKKAAIEQELQGAIAAMKKPNPRMAVKDLVEASDKRAAVALKSRSKFLRDLIIYNQLIRKQNRRILSGILLRQAFKSWQLPTQTAARTSTQIYLD